MAKIIIMGSGFSSLSAASYLSQQGHQVTIFEKNESIGGRARQLSTSGFTFDMGPTFYWMPDIFEKFFQDFGKSVSDFYTLIRLDPGYRVYFEQGDYLEIAASLEKIYAMFEKEEPGSSQALKQFLKDAEFNYRVAIDKVVYKPGKHIGELIMPETIARLPQFLQTLSTKVRKHIKSPKLQQLLEFPVLFLGAKASNIPAFYCFMNYADMVLGTWHIQGGMFELVKAMQRLAEGYGTIIHTSSPVSQIVVEDGMATGVVVNGMLHHADIVISGADYQHTEQLLPAALRNYSQSYWDKRTFAPSALLYYVGFSKKLEHIAHHTLFFDTDFEAHAHNIYTKPAWPQEPLFYASFPSVTDSGAAPSGHETGIFLVPIAPGLHDTEEIRNQYFEQIISRMEHITQQPLRDSIVLKECFASHDFIKDYNAYKGNAYGLANTLWQTAFLKPKMRNKQIANLFYTGQLTVPGPGVPPAIISGKIVSELVQSYLNK